MAPTVLPLVWPLAVKLMFSVPVPTPDAVMPAFKVRPLSAVRVKLALPPLVLLMAEDTRMLPSPVGLVAVYGTLPAEALTPFVV